MSRAPGRPRRPGVDEAILHAALEVVAQHGVRGASLEAIARRAGVGRATIYRRWRHKDELIAAAFVNVGGAFEPPSTGSVREDIVAYLRHRIRGAHESPLARVLPALAAELLGTPELMETYAAGVVKPRRAVMAGILREGLAAGQLRPDLDVELTIDLLAGVLFYQEVLRPGEPVPDDLPERVVDLVWAGISAG